MMAANYRHIGGGENRLGRHYSRFRRFGPPQPLPINHLLCENRRTQGRIGEVGLTYLMDFNINWRPPKTWQIWWFCDSMNRFRIGGCECGVRLGFLTLTSG